MRKTLLRLLTLSTIIGIFINSIGFLSNEFNAKIDDWILYLGAFSLNTNFSLIYNDLFYYSHYYGGYEFSYNVNYLNLFFYGFMGTGLLVYWQSKGQKKRILLFSVMTLWMVKSYQIFGLIFYDFFINLLTSSFNITFNFSFFVYVSLNIIYWFISWFLLDSLHNKEVINQLAHKTSTKTFLFDRLLIYIIDFTIVILISSSSFVYLEPLFKTYLTPPVPPIVIMAGFIVLNYFLLISLTHRFLKTSPGKYLFGFYTSSSSLLVTMRFKNNIIQLNPDYQISYSSILKTIAIMALFQIGTQFVSDQWHHYNFEMNKFEAHKEKIIDVYQNHTTNAIYAISNNKNKSSNYANHIIKLNKVTTDSLYADVVTIPNTKYVSSDEKDQLEYFKRHKQESYPIHISKEDFDHLIIKDFSEYQETTDGNYQLNDSLKGYIKDTHIL